MDDLALVYKIDVGPWMPNDGENKSSIVITDELLEKYEITKDELHEIAMDNLMKEPVKLRSLEDIIKEFVVDNFIQEGMSAEAAENMAEGMVPKSDMHIYVMGNESGVNGAVSILNEEKLNEIQEQVGECFILPSSIHETILVPKSEISDLEVLNDMVQDVNTTQVAPGEVLSDHVYEYDMDEHALFRSDRAEEHQKQKEEKHVEKSEKTERGEKAEKTSLKEKLAEKKASVEKNDVGKDVMKKSRGKEQSL